MAGAGVMAQAFGVRVDPVAWADAVGAGSTDDLALWMNVCCRDADELAERVRQLDAELADLPCPELSQAAVRAWVALAALQALLDTARRQVHAATEGATGRAGVLPGGFR